MVSMWIRGCKRQMNRLKVKKKKGKKAERRRRVGARRGGESARFMLSVDAEAVNSKESVWASFWDLKLLILLFVSARLGPHDCGPQRNPFGKRLLRLCGLVLRSSGGRGSVWQLTEEPHNFSSEVLLFSVQALRIKIG